MAIYCYNSAILIKIRRDDSMHVAIIDSDGDKINLGTREEIAVVIDVEESVSS